MSAQAPASVPTEHPLPATIRTVGDSIDALCTHYRDGAAIIREIKRKRKGLDISAQELELSVTRAESCLRDQYEKYRHKLGELFYCGDGIAFATLQDITLHVRDDIVANLQAHYQQDASIDFSAIRDVCDAEQERAASVLLELQQRMIEKASEEPNETPPSQSDPVNAGSMASIESNTVDDQKNIPGRLPSRTDDVDRADRPKCISAPQPPEPLTPPATPHPTQAHSPAQSPRSRASADSGRIARRSGDPYRPVATTVTKTGLFGFGSRITVERTTNPPENPLVDEYLADTLKRNSKRLSGRLSATTVDPFADSLERPVFDEHNDSICFDSRMLASQSDHMISNSSPNSLDPTDLLPNELNNYAGFCKGAWRHQMGDTKRAMEERIRPGGMYKQAKFWQCKHCNFEGRSVPIDKKKNGHDMRVFKLISGVQFRWDFLFKTHFAKLKEHDLNPTNATFGCIFCCSKGKETPTFEGIESFMGHLGDHRERLPTGEVLYRMNCLVGRQASSTEDFDINFISAVD